MGQIVQRFGDKIFEYIELKEKKLVVLDLDGTIIDSDVNSKTITSETHIINVEGVDYKITIRPYFKEFKEWLFKNYQVAIWTNALMIYAKPVLKLIFKEHYQQILFIWDRQKSVSCCYNNSVLLMKPLNKIIEEYSNFSIDDIVIIEDTPSNCIEFIENCYSINTYSTDTENPDSSLLDIIQDFQNGIYCNILKYT